MKAEEFKGSAPLLVDSKAAVFRTLTVRTPEAGQSSRISSAVQCDPITFPKHSLACGRLAFKALNSAIVYAANEVICAGSLLQLIAASAETKKMPRLIIRSLR